MTADALSCLSEPKLACPSLVMLDVRQVRVPSPLLDITLFSHHSVISCFCTTLPALFQCDFVDDVALVAIKRTLVKAAQVERKGTAKAKCLPVLMCLPVAVWTIAGYVMVTMMCLQRHNMWSCMQYQSVMDFNSETARRAVKN